MTMSTGHLARTALVVGLISAGLYASLVRPATTGSAQGPATPLNLHYTTAHQLSVNGLRLAEPMNERPLVSRDRAIRIAEDAYPGISSENGAREVALAIVTDTAQHPTMNRLCWIVDITPPNGLPVPAGPIGAPSKRAAWFFVFVDATSGNIDLAEGGS
jgi:hypothetical protein